MWSEVPDMLHVGNCAVSLCHYPYQVYAGCGESKKTNLNRKSRGRYSQSRHGIVQLCQPYIKYIIARDRCVSGEAPAGRGWTKATSRGRVSGREAPYGPNTPKYCEIRNNMNVSGDRPDGQRRQNFNC